MRLKAAAVAYLTYWYCLEQFCHICCLPSSLLCFRLWHIWQLDVYIVYMNLWSMQCTEKLLAISNYEKVTNKEVLVATKETRSTLKTFWHRKRRWLDHVLGQENFLHKIIERKMMGKATWGTKRMKLLHYIMEGRDCGQLKDLIADRLRWRQDSKWQSVSENCWKQRLFNSRRPERETMHSIFSCRVKTFRSVVKTYLVNK